MRNRAFQLTAKEARATVDVVNGMYVVLISFIALMFMLIICT